MNRHSTKFMAQLEEYEPTEDDLKAIEQYRKEKAEGKLIKDEDLKV